MNPFLEGNFGPWRMEGVADDLTVVGQIPRELNGTYYRTGPNPAFEPARNYHWFDGDGMIHAITLEDGRARYRNRYVQSRGLAEEREHAVADQVHRRLVAGEQQQQDRAGELVLGELVAGFLHLHQLAEQAIVRLAELDLAVKGGSRLDSRLELELALAELTSG